MDFRIVFVKELLDKLVSNNFLSPKFEVSLLRKMKTTLLRVLTVLGDGDDDDVKDMLRDAVLEVRWMFLEIEALCWKVEDEFGRVISSKLRKLIESLEGLSSGEQVSVFKSDWNGTPSPTNSVLVDESSLQFISLPTSVSVLLDKLVSGEFVDNFRATKLDVSLLENLKITLLAVLVDARVNIKLLDLHDAGEIHTLGLWLYMLEYVVFQVYNLFDEINREALLFKVKPEYEILTPSPVLNNHESRFKWLNREPVYETPTLPSWVLYNHYSPFKRFNMVINSKLIKLTQRLEFLSSRLQGQFGGSSSNSFWQETHSNFILDDESSIYGRDNDIKELKDLLLSSDGDHSEIGIISIVGMEGIGKTTLAKLLYNDPEVYDKFELEIWVHVSKDFDEIIVLEIILAYLETKRNDTTDMNNIYPKCLLILDEVCDARSIRTLLMNISNLGKTGSRIIITTQDERVALSMQTFGLSMRTFLSVHYLRPLESEDCWSLLSGHAFGACNDQRQSNLEEIGREIANKCYGSPFAAVALGDILRSKLSSDYWNYVLESDIRVLTDHDVQPFIQLSYHYLPTPLKRCFAYCSIFPKKSIMEKNMVVQLWIAEGLVQSSINQEKVGEEYFDILVSRSLIHRRSIGDEEANFEMHNLVHDLATKVSSPNCINMDEHDLHDMVHSLSYNRGTYDSYNKFDKLYGLKDIRTFLALPLQEQLPLCLLSNKVVHDLLPTMKQLRVLSLSNYKSITEVPNSIGNFLHLQYLNLSHTKIERLPSETCKLYNLQFLLLSGCKRLTELPENMGKLVNLRHLDISDTALTEMPIQIAKLENLHTLSDFVVSKHSGGLKVGELGKYPHLHGKLSISQLQNVNDHFEAVQANMKMKERIDELSLEWDCGSTFTDSQIQSVVLEHLRPSTNLKSLTIKGYSGINFPNWLGDSLFSNMVYLRISNCGHCLWLPPLGQLGNLKKLIIEGM